MLPVVGGQAAVNSMNNTNLPYAKVVVVGKQLIYVLQTNLTNRYSPHHRRRIKHYMRSRHSLFRKVFAQVVKPEGSGVQITIVVNHHRRRGDHATLVKAYIIRCGNHA
jgi:hypothetical protein